MKLIKIDTQEIFTRSELISFFEASGIDISIPSDLSSVDLSEFGFAFINPASPPEVPLDQVAFLTDGAIFAAGKYYEMWDSRQKTPEEFQKDKDGFSSKVEADLASAFSGGFTVPFGTLQGQVLQTRGLEDRTNWLTSQAAYSAAMMGGHGAVLGASFRTASNETFTVTYQEGFNVLLAMADWGKTIMSISWNLKDQIKNASTYEELLAIDLDGPWQ